MTAGLGPLTLGEIIQALEDIQKGVHGIDGTPNSEKSVWFDFVFLQPTSLASYRGYYEDLAMGYSSEFDGKGPRVDGVLIMLRNAVGLTYTGWKGGEFLMSIKTPVWVANQGESGGTAIVGVLDDGMDVILETKVTDR